MRGGERKKDVWTRVKMVERGWERLKSGRKCRNILDECIRELKRGDYGKKKEEGGTRHKITLCHPAQRFSSPSFKYILIAKGHLCGVF